eukprot:6101304-Prymnesium_polylepis.1
MGLKSQSPHSLPTPDTGSSHMFGISLAGSTFGCSAVIVCLARLSDVSSFLVPATTRATLYALGTGNRDASIITTHRLLARRLLRDITTTHNTVRSIPPPIARKQHYIMHSDSRATSPASRSARVRVQHALGHDHMI